MTLSIAGYSGSYTVPFPSLSLSLLSSERARRSFALFVEAAWHVIEPSSQFVPGWHIDAISEHLQAVSHGQIKRLLVNMPPRHAKSSLISVLWPVWTWLHAPGTRFLCASYAMSLAIRDNRKCRLLIQSNWFQQRYGSIFQLSGDQNVKGRFENTARGYRLAVSVGSAATGEGGDILLIDDAHPAADANSDAKRETALTWFRETWSSRLNDRETGAMVVVGQRVHKEDVSGIILEQGGWTHLNLPAEFDPQRTCFTSIGWSDPRRVEGELLWPARFNAETLETIKNEIGPLGYATQYQQSPIPPGGYIFKEADERLFEEDEQTYILNTPGGKKALLKSDCWLVGTMDLAISSKQTADYTVVQIWAITPARDLLLLHSIRGRWSHAEQQKYAKQIYHEYQPEYMSIETVAYQLSMFQDLINQGIPCREYKPTKDKVSRASGAATWQSVGKLYFLKGASYLGVLREEVYYFPQTSHDDIVDNLSMAADIVRSRGPLSSETDEVDQFAGRYDMNMPDQPPPAPLIDPFAWGGGFDD